jgi:energy-coupling factor transporter transmembrane protein EcfT
MTVIMYMYMCVYLLFPGLITMNKQVVLSAVALRFIVKLLTHEHLKTIENVMRFRAQLDGEISQRHRCMTGVTHLKKTEQRFKSCED